MLFFISLCGASVRHRAILVLWLGFAALSTLEAQTNELNVPVAPGADTNQVPVAPNVPADMNQIPVAPIAAPETNAPPAVAAPATNPPPAEPAVAPAVAAPPAAAAVSTATNASPAPMPKPQVATESQSASLWLMPMLLALGALGGFVLYHCGLTRAKNCGHTATLALVGVFFALIAFWAGGFAVQTGGIGDTHAALADSPLAGERNALDHELGFMLGGHYWGVMGSSGFFLTSDEAAHNDNPGFMVSDIGSGGWIFGNTPDVRSGIAALFLPGAAFLVIAVAAALGAGLERGRLLPLVVAAFIIGAILYPLVANWAWGGGWLAGLGREFSLGHGFVDQGGAVVVHATAGVLAMVLASMLGPRYGRVGREKVYRAIPGHNMPFVVLGASVLLISFTAANAFGFGTPYDSPEVAVVNTLLAAAGGLFITYLSAGWRRKRPEPAMLCRGLLGGAVAVSAGSALFDSWAAFVIGGVAGLVVIGAMDWLNWRRIDDPAGATAVHGAAGMWGGLALGFFADELGSGGCNGVNGPVRGLFFGGSWHQLAAQAVGVVAIWLVILLLGYVCFGLIQKILGTRAELVAEVEGLDFSQTGAFGYQPDVEPGSANGDAAPGGGPAS